MKTLKSVLHDAFPAASFTGIPADDLRPGCIREWDSLGNVNLLLLVEETYGVRFDADQLSDLKSLKAIWAAVAASRPDVRLE